MPHESENEPLVAVVAPLRAELAPFLDRLEEREKLVRRGRACFWRATLGGRSLVVGWTGDGHAAADAGLRTLLEGCAVKHLVIAGVAGGLSRDLGLADVVVAREVHDADGLAGEADLRWAFRGVLLRARPGLVYTHGRIASTVDEKSELWQRLGRPENATVDLETAIYVRLAAERGIPFTALRAVSDTADEDLAVDFNRFANAGGHTRMRKVLRYALGHPEVLLELRALQQRLHRCAERLDRMLAGLVVENKPEA